MKENLKHSEHLIFLFTLSKKDFISTSFKKTVLKFKRFKGGKGANFCVTSVLLVILNLVLLVLCFISCLFLFI